MTGGRLMLFAPGGQEAYGTRIADALGLALSPLEAREFEDGEHKARPLASVPPLRLDRRLLQDRVRVIDAAPLLAEAIRRLHAGEPLTGLDALG